MTEVEALCRELLRNHLKLVEDFCQEAVYATDKEVRESEILEDCDFPNDFRVICARYGKPRNFINLLHRELKKTSKGGISGKQPITAGNCADVPALLKRVKRGDGKAEGLY